MRKISRIAFVVLLAAILGTLVWALLQRPELEPVYHGKPLSYWLQGLPGGASRNSGAKAAPTSEEAQAALQAIGTNALPFLLKQLRQGYSPLKEKCYTLLQKQHFIKNPFNPPWIHLMQAHGGLTALHEQVDGAVPQLIEIYDRHSDPVQRQIITSIFATLPGPLAKEAVPVLLRGLTDTDELVRNNSAYALGKIHEAPQLAVPALIKCLHDPASIVRARAAASLGKFGGDAQSALPALEELLSREQAAPAGSNTMAVGRFSFSATAVIYGSPTRLKRSGAFPFGFDTDVIDPTKKAIKAINLAAPKPETETNTWSAWPKL